MASVWNCSNDCWIAPPATSIRWPTDLQGVAPFLDCLAVFAPANFTAVLRQTNFPARRHFGFSDCRGGRITRCLFLDRPFRLHLFWALLRSAATLAGSKFFRRVSLDCGLPAPPIIVLAHAQWILYLTSRLFAITADKKSHPLVAGCSVSLLERV